MINKIESVSRQTEEKTSFVWNFSTGPSPWRITSPQFHLNDNRECNLVIEGTHTNNCVSRLQYKLRLRLVFASQDTGYFKEHFEVRARLGKKELRFKLARCTEREFSDEMIIHHHSSLSRQSVQLQIELVCRTVHEDKSYGRLPYDNNVAGLSQDMRYLLDTGYASDIDIEATGGAIFRAHRSILACRSNVLAKMTEHDMLERRTGRIQLWDWEPEVVRRLLYYVYTGQYDLSVDTCHELFKLAHYLELHDLQIQCKLYILLNLSVDNITDTLALTCHDQYDMEDVRRAAMSFILANETRCATSQELMSFLGENLTVDNLAFVLMLAHRQHHEPTLMHAMNFIKRNFVKLRNNEEVNNYLVSNPHFMIQMVNLPSEAIDNNDDLYDRFPFP